MWLAVIGLTAVGCEPPEPATTFQDVAPLLAAAEVDAAEAAEAAIRGGELFRTLGCVRCHRFDGVPLNAPRLDRLGGAPVLLARRGPDGGWEQREREQDAAYVYESITRPQAWWVEDHRHASPMSWFGWLDARQVADLMLYLASRSDDPGWIRRGVEPAGPASDPQGAPQTSI